MKEKIESLMSKIDAVVWIGGMFIRGGLTGVQAMIALGEE